MNTDEKVSLFFYLFAVIILILGAGILIFLKIFGISVNDFLTSIIGPCIYRQTLGIYCPGCGGVRSVIFLLSGDLLQSFLYHPFTIYAVVLLFLLFVIGSLSFLTKGKIRMPKIRPIYLYIGAGIILVQWVVKLVALLIFKTPLIPF